MNMKTFDVCVIISTPHITSETIHNETVIETGTVAEIGFEVYVIVDIPGSVLRL